MRKTERIAVALMLLSVAAAWVAGGLRRQADLVSLLPQALPGSGDFQLLADGLYAASDEDSGAPAGYVALGEARGYGGPLRVALGTDRAGRIARVVVIDHKETEPFFRRVARSGLPAGLAGKACADPLALGADVEAVSGATLTSVAVVRASRRAARRIGKDALGLEVPPEEKRPVVFGVRETLLLLLALAAQVALFRGFKYRKQARAATLAGGLAIVGFLYATPLSIVNLNACLMGYWPDWRERLGWYFICAAVFLPILLRGTNSYCSHLCPFGAAQECLGLVGGAKRRVLPGLLRRVGNWFPRLLAWGIVVAALLRRAPGAPNHEVFGVLFERTGTTLQATVLVGALLASLFVRRPWCDYLCAVRPFSDLAAGLRKSLRQAPRDGEERPDDLAIPERNDCG